jgi:Zn finger protein HypA/HybF involved in hydrogenase expression
MKKPKAITLSRITRMIERDECEGICRKCGETAHGVEPDARRYKCESCGERAVYGAEELLVMVAS